MVRQIEVYKASHRDQQVKVYFLMYEKSVDEQRYLSSISRESDAFERLIREKAVSYLI